MARVVRPAPLQPSSNLYLSVSFFEASPDLAVDGFVSPEAGDAPPSFVDFEDSEDNGG